MRRLLGFLLRGALLVAIAFWLADQPGTAVINWHGYVVQSSAAMLAFAILIVAYVFYLLFRAWHLLRQGPELWRLNRKLKQLQSGQDYLTQGLVAVAGGHAAEAGRLSLAARKKLGTTTATLLLQAQAAQLAHDHRTARSIFRAMIEDPERAILGYRGLIMEARRANMWDEVRRLTAEVALLKPDMPWLDWVRFEMATRRLAWHEAENALDRLAPTRLLDKETLHRHRAALLIASSAAIAETSSPQSLELAEQAVKQAPQWLPALINLASRQSASDYGRAARRTAEKAWELQPHPQLAEILRRDDKDAMDNYKQIAYMCRRHEDDAVTHQVMGEAALAADLWGEARRHLIMLVAREQATQSTYRLLSKLERRENGDDAAATQWLNKAGDAAPDPAWLCSACGGAHKTWQATCRSCGAFATQEWRRPGVSTFISGTPLSLLSNWSE